MWKGWKRVVAVVLVISSIGIASSTALSTKLAFAPRGALLRGRQQFQARTLRPKQSSIKMAAADGGQMVENSDICELPDKTVFSGSWLAAALGLQPSTGLAFTIPGSDVVRGPHSVAARLLLQKDPEQSMMLPDSVFLKRVVPSQLPARAATKWIRDTQSYRTEGSFLSHILCGCLQMNMKISRLVNANLMPGQQLASMHTSWRRYASKASCSPSPTRSCRRDSKI